MLGVVIIFVISIFILFMWGSVIKPIIIYKKSGSISRTVYTIIYNLLVIVAIFSWFFNFGWTRVIATGLGLPIIHTVVFIIITNNLLRYIDKSNKIKKYVIVSYITYILAYVLLPDFGDIGPNYMFFGLIRNNNITNKCFVISRMLFLANIITLVLGLIAKRKCRKIIEETT